MLGSVGSCLVVLLNSNIGMIKRKLLNVLWPMVQFDGGQVKIDTLAR